MSILLLRRFFPNLEPPRVVALTAFARARTSKACKGAATTARIDSLSIYRKRYTAPEAHAYELFFDEAGIRSDLRECRRIDRPAFNEIIVVLGELRGNPSRSEDFVLPGFEDGTVEDVRWIESLGREGIDATRVRLRDVQAWRLIFFVDHGRRVAALAAVMHRPQNYEADPVLWQRLRESYERLGFA
jgi:hypothetical protein